MTKRARTPDRFDAVMPAGRGTGEPVASAPRPPLDDFLIWLYGVTVKRVPTDEEVIREAEKRGVGATRVEYKPSSGNEVTTYELHDSANRRSRATVGLVVLFKLGNARALWPVLYRGCLPPKGANRHPHAS